VANGGERSSAEQADRAWIMQRVAAAQAKRWFGTLTITFVDGMAKLFKKEETELPPSAIPTLPRSRTPVES
jgi:hypothetical protein